LVDIEVEKKCKEIIFGRLEEKVINEETTVDEIKKLCQQYFNLQKDLQKEERKVEK
jgi:signal transduction histidine kinase